MKIDTTSIDDTVDDEIDLPEESTIPDQPAKNGRKKRAKQKKPYKEVTETKDPGYWTKKIKEAREKEEGWKNQKGGSGYQRPSASDITDQSRDGQPIY